MPVATALKLLGPSYSHELVAEVFVTQELLRRSEREGRRRTEEAFDRIFEILTTDPDSMLPQLVKLALQCCDAHSGGISLLVPGDDHFVWHHLTGELSRFNGGSTPRHYSPCGVVLDTNSTVLVIEPERIYSWLSDAGISLSEVLLVPIHDGSIEPIGTLWVVSSAQGHFTNSDALLLEELADICRLGLQLSWTSEKVKEGRLDQSEIVRAIKRRLKKLKFA
jgi:GAF domain-containing protein